MISGIARLVLALVLPATPSPAAPDVSALIAGLARPVPSSTGYKEVRFVKMLRKPLVLRGVLTYNGPGQLGKRVETPYQEMTTIAADRVKVERADRAPKQFDIERAPELKALLSGFSALLSGDASMLRELYTIDLADSATAWTLTLTPRQSLAKHLRALIVQGAGAEPHCFTMQQNDGDSSVMLLGPLAAAPLPEPLTAPALTKTCAQ